MSAMERIEAAVQESRKAASLWTRLEVANGLTVGPYCRSTDADEDGFAVFLDGLPFGWWKDREEACRVAKDMSDAIKAFDPRVPPPW